MQKLTGLSLLRKMVANFFENQTDHIKSFEKAEFGYFLIIGLIFKVRALIK